MSSGRFKLSFNNGGNNRFYNSGNLVNLSTVPAGQPPAPKTNQALNAPMIGRVYKARPGCSACGKKVA